MVQFLPLVKTNQKCLTSGYAEMLPVHVGGLLHHKLQWSLTAWATSSAWRTHWSKRTELGWQRTEHQLQRLEHTIHQANYGWQPTDHAWARRKHEWQMIKNRFSSEKFGPNTRLFGPCDFRARLTFVLSKPNTSTQSTSWNNWELAPVSYTHLTLPTS